MNSIRATTCASTHSRPAVTLLEIICVVLVVGFTVGLMTEAFTGHLAVNRRLTASAARASTLHSLTQRLRSDLLSAATFKVSNSSDDGGVVSTLTVQGSTGATSYAFHRVDRREEDAERDPAVDQVIVRTDANGEEHRWLLQAQTIDVEPSPVAPTRIVTLRFRQNGRSAPGFNRRENLDLSLMTGGIP